MMKKIMIQWIITINLIIIGVLKWDILKQPIPKTLHMMLCTCLKLIIVTFFANKRTYFVPYIILISFCLTAGKYLLMQSKEHLEIVLLAILAPVKIVYILLFYLIIFKKKYTFLQYISIFSIILANFLIQIKFNNKKLSNHMIYVFCSLFANLFMACALIIFDKKIREKKMGYWNYLFTHAFTSLILTFFELIIEFKYSEYHFLKYLKDWKFFANIIMTVAETFLTTYLVFNFTPLEKSINNNLVIVSTTFISNLFYKEPLTALHILAFSITYAAIFIFERQSAKIKKAQTQEETSN